MSSRISYDGPHAFVRTKAGLHSRDGNTYFACADSQNAAQLQPRLDDPPQGVGENAGQRRTESDFNRWMIEKSKNSDYAHFWAWRLFPSRSPNPVKDDGACARQQRHRGPSLQQVALGVVNDRGEHATRGSFDENQNAAPTAISLRRTSK